MTMNLSWLDDFAALAASGNFSRAADERHMTQPAFSRRVRALEEWLGVDLESKAQLMLAHGHARVRGPLDEAGCPSLVVGTDRLIPVLAPDKNGRPVHRLPPDGKSTAVHLLSYSAESGLGRILRELKGLILDRLHAPNVLTAHLASVLRTMALDGRGLAWLPQVLVGDDIDGGRLVVAAPEEWLIDLEIRLYRDRAALGKAAETFWLAAQASVGVGLSHTAR